MVNRPSRAAGAIALAFVAACWVQETAHAKTIDVTIEHFAFAPASVEVESGDTVVFTNRDIAPHTATATDGSWTTKEIASGKSESVTVPAKGDGAYFCKYHPVMKGRLVIKPSL